MKEILNKIASNCQKALLTSGYNRVKPAVSNKKKDETNKPFSTDKYENESNNRS